MCGGLGPSFPPQRGADLTSGDARELGAGGTLRVLLHVLVLPVLPQSPVPVTWTSSSR